MFLGRALMLVGFARGPCGVAACDGGAAAGAFCANPKVDREPRHTTTRQHRRNRFILANTFFRKMCNAELPDSLRTHSCRCGPGTGVRLGQLTASLIQEPISRVAFVAIVSGPTSQDRDVGHPMGEVRNLREVSDYMGKDLSQSRKGGPRSSRLRANSTVALRKPSLSPASWRLPS